MHYARKPLARAVAIALATAGSLWATPALADEETQQQIRALKAQVELLMRKVDDLQRKEETTAAKTEQIEKRSAAASAVEVGKAVVKGMEFYGNLDLSVDTTTKGIAGFIANNGVDTPVGKVGWLPAISTNISYIGVRGRHDVGNGLAAVYQLETQLDISATAGTVNTTSSNDSVVKGALTSRDSFLGLAGDWGSVKIG